MLKIKCPYCGDRAEDEFKWGGPTHISRPVMQDNCTDQVWAEYLHMRDNPKGESLERWCHIHGCGEWFNLARDTVSHKINRIYRMGQSRDG